MEQKDPDLPRVTKEMDPRKVEKPKRTRIFGRHSAHGGAVKRAKPNGQPTALVQDPAPVVQPVAPVQNPAPVVQPVAPAQPQHQMAT
jgi:hypothetical protein